MGDSIDDIVLQDELVDIELLAAIADELTDLEYIADVNFGDDPL